MLRPRLSEALKRALKVRDHCTISTVRLSMAAVKDRDITLRGSGKGECITDDEILSLLQTMVRQRRESIVFFQQGKREDLADRERKEIEVIRGFMPAQLDDDEIRVATKEVIEQLNAEGLKDMGRVMGALKEKYSGQIDIEKTLKLLNNK